MPTLVDLRFFILGVVSAVLWLAYLLSALATYGVQRKRLLKVGTVASILCILSLILTFFYQSKSLTWFGDIPGKGDVKLNWWPWAIHDLPHLPYEFVLFASLLTLGLWVLHHFQLERFFWLVWVLILVQCFFHLSVHSPYTYLPHFEQLGKEDYWYLTFLFPNQKGAVNSDAFWFWQSEALYLGGKGTVEVFWSRVLPHFLSTRFSTFIPSLHAWVIVNCVFWMLSVLALYSIGKLFFSKHVARGMAFLQASSPALINYVGQAKPYALAFALLGITVAIFFHALRNKKQILEIGTCLGVTALCYEFQPWFIVFPLIALFKKEKPSNILLFTFIGLGIYSVFLASAKILPGIKVKDTVMAGYGNPMENIYHLLRSQDFVRVGNVLHESLKSFWVLSFNAFSCVFPFSILGGILLWRKYYRERFLLSLLLPGLLASLIIGATGQTLYFHYPRVVFGNYVGMYLMAALCLDWIGQRFSYRWMYGILCLNTLYWNLDVWGSPAIYFHWFYRYSRFAPWW